MDRDVLEHARDLAQKTVALKQFADMAGAKIHPDDVKAIREEVEEIGQQLTPIEPEIELKPNIKLPRERHRPTGGL